MAAHVSSAFFTEENYESFSLRPKFDINLFKTYNPCIEGYIISPIKKSKPSQANKNNAAETDELELSSSAQPNKNISQTVASCIGQNPLNTSVWTLKSPNSRFPYPRYSCLTHTQQQKYIELWQKHVLRHPAQTRYSICQDDITEKQQFRKLQMSVNQEQQEFMKYAEHVARHCPRDYEHLSPLALQFATDQWKCQEQRVKQLPQHFSVYQTVGIVPTAVFPTDSVFTFSARLLGLGQPRVVDESSLESKVNHNLILASNRQTAGRQGHGRDDVHEEISNDENAVKLATKYQANIVIASTALAMLVDNHAPGYDKNWQIPVNIKSTKMADTDTALKTVYISGPLTNPHFSHEVSRVFHQVALHDLLTQDPQGQRSVADPDGKANTAKDFGTSMEVDNEYDDSLELDLTNLETFGSLSEKPCRENLKEKQFLPKTEVHRKSSQSDEKDGGSISNDIQNTPEQHLSGADFHDHHTDSSGRLLASCSKEVTETESSRAAPNVSEGADNLSSSKSLQCRVAPREQLSSEKHTARPSGIDAIPKVSPQPERMTFPQLQTSCASLPYQNLSPKAIPPSNAVKADEPKFVIDTFQETKLEVKTGQLMSVPVTDDSLKVAEPEETQRSHSETFSQDGEMSMYPPQGSRTNESRLLSDESDTERELMIALSSGPDSPQRTTHHQSAVRPGTNEIQNINQCRKDPGNESNKESPNSDNTKVNQQTDSDKISTRTRIRRPSSEMSSGIAPEEALTPRRSKRLLKIQPSDAGHSTLPRQSGRAPKQSVPNIQVPSSVVENVKNVKGSASDLPSQEDTRNIPDSPLSPPYLEKGLSTQASLISQTSAETSSSSSTGKIVESGTLFPKTCQTRIETSVPNSPQIKKQKLDSHGILDNSVLEDKQTPFMRYNLRSKLGVTGKCDQSVSVGSEAAGVNTDTMNRTVTFSSNANFDQSLPAAGKLSHCSVDENKISITRNLPGEGSTQQNQASKIAAHVDNQNMHREHDRNSTSTDYHDSKKSHAPRQHTPHVKGKHSLPINKTGVESTVDSILKLQEQLHTSKMVHQSSSQPPVNISSGSMHPCSQGDVCFENASDYKSPTEGSVDYSLWRFGRHSVIVKSNIDVVCRNYADENNKDQVAAIIPKMEYQPHFGHEQISVSELTKIWMALLLHPGSKVIQGRVNALTSDLMMLEHFDMNSALWDQPSFQPSRCMKMMFQILEKLTSLPEGHYLLCHSAGDMHACVLQTVIPTGNKRSLFDLHHIYTQVPKMQSCPPSLLPWLPLDTNLLLPGHVATGRIPATFPPKDTGQNVKAGGVGKGTSKKKKKKKKKGGKK